MKSLLCLALALPVFVACSVEESSAKETSAPAEASGETATITYVCTGGEHETSVAASEGVPECCGSPMNPKP